jgi:hypothetical protein
MKLTVLERIILSSLLPSEADITTLLIVRELREKLSFTEAEHELLKFTPASDGRLTWQDGVEAKEIEVGKKAKELVCQQLSALNAEKKLTVDHISLWAKFKGKAKE